MEPLVTVIVTVFKRVEFIREAIESVLAQTFESYEIIVTDDADSEAAKTICESVSRPDRVRYRSNKRRLGVALNLRVAILEARGKYVAILNDDDYWEPNFLFRLVLPLEQDSGRVLAFSDHWIMLQDGKIDMQQTDRNTKIFKRDKLSEGELRNTTDLALNKTIPLVQASVFRKEFLDTDLLVTNVSGAYDFWITCLLAVSGQPFYYVAERLTRYRTHPQMETLRLAADKFEPEVFIYRSLLQANYFPEWQKFIEQQLAYILYRCGRARLEFNDIEKARQLFKESLRLFLSWKAVLRLSITYLPRPIRLGLSFTQIVD
ncbi:glycosyltransferase family 2 protein [Dolichospermum flos-aquae]|uniref:Glycosyltransferase family 2 protein n=1 Tax=Dolichospermum flos-aquae CCAP 1403/13F TaxID=315271 RepID=A0A6H2C5E2_DOLFA|nr:glycosyltransferase family 2 protein [Dolichospermum flos-aquae]QJB46747.1 glycosyltransferase family 2 protein [Dolichospermum flos-aquae CCAP 1403/13F]